MRSETVIHDQFCRCRACKPPFDQDRPNLWGMLAGIGASVALWALAIVLVMR